MRIQTGVLSGVQTEVQEREGDGQNQDLAGLKLFALTPTHSLTHLVTSLGNTRGAFAPKNIKWMLKKKKSSCHR